MISPDGPEPSRLQDRRRVALVVLAEVQHLVEDVAPGATVRLAGVIDNSAVDEADAVIGDVPNQGWAPRAG